jgi:hypothetical protein
LPVENPNSVSQLPLSSHWKKHFPKATRSEAGACDSNEAKRFGTKWKNNLPTANNDQREWFNGNR